MGVPLTPIVEAHPIELSALRGRKLAVDGNAELYQFLALIRLRDGSPLTDAKGRITSHLSGLFFRTTRLLAEHAPELVFVFDGAPPVEKLAELQRRRETKARFAVAREAAIERGDLADAYGKATMTSRLTREMMAEAKELLQLLGIATVQAPSEGEAQCAHMAIRGDVWAAASKDYDTLLFGAPRVLRFLSVGGKEFLPSKGAFRPVPPELLDLEVLLGRWRITREGLVDLALLVGTDFNDGVKGIGPKKALRLVQQFGTIDSMPAEIRAAVGDTEPLRRIYLSPNVTAQYDLAAPQRDLDGVLRFLCDERQFGRDRVEAALGRAFAVR